MSSLWASWNTHLSQQHITSTTHICTLSKSVKQKIPFNLLWQLFLSHFTERSRLDGAFNTCLVTNRCHLLGWQVSVCTRYLLCHKLGPGLKWSYWHLVLGAVGGGRLPCSKAASFWRPHSCIIPVEHNTLLSYAAQMESCEHSKQANSQTLWVLSHFFS